MSLDTLPLEILALIISHIPPTPCVNDFEYSFSVTNNKPLKPHQILLPYRDTQLSVAGPFDYYKYNIYSPYLSLQDVLELSYTCKLLKTKVYSIVFKDCAANSEKYYDDLFHATSSPKQSSFAWFSSRTSIKDASPKLSVFLQKSYYNPAWITARIPISSVANTSILLAMSRFSFTIGMDIAHRYRKASMTESTVKMLNALSAPNLQHLAIVIKEDEFWTPELVKTLAENLSEYKLIGYQTPWLAITVNCPNSFKILSYCESGLVDKVRSLAFDSNAYFCDTTRSPNGRNLIDTDFEHLFLTLVPQFRNLQKLHCDMVHIDFRRYPLGSSSERLNRLASISQQFSKKLLMLPHLNAVSLVDEYNRYHLPLWLTSAPATLKALIAYGDSFYHEKRNGCPNDSEVEVYQYIKNTSNVFPGLVQLCLYNMYAPPERFEAPHLYSLALLNNKLSFASNFYDSVWKNFFVNHGATLTRLFVSHYKLSSELLLSLFKNLPQLVQLEIVRWSGPKSIEFGLNHLFLLLTETPGLCSHLGILMLPITSKELSFKAIHKFVNAIPIRRLSFCKSTGSGEASFLTNDFLSDYEDFAKATFPYILQQVDYTTQTPYKIFSEDVCNVTGAHLTSEMLQALKTGMNEQPMFEYRLHLELLRDIGIVDLDDVLGTTFLHEGTNKTVASFYKAKSWPELMKLLHDAKHVITTSKKWF